MVAENMCFSFELSNAKVLANKIVTTFQLSSEQLSSQVCKKNSNCVKRVA